MPDSAPYSGSDEEWEALMRQLRQQRKATPRPFFYARVQARLLAPAGAAPPLVPQWLRRPAYAVVLGALVLAVSGDGSAAPAGTSPRSSYPAQPGPR